MNTHHTDLDRRTAATGEIWPSEHCDCLIAGAIPAPSSRLINGLFVRTLIGGMKLGSADVSARRPGRETDDHQPEALDRAHNRDEVVELHRLGEEAVRVQVVALD